MARTDENLCLVASGQVQGSATDAQLPSFAGRFVTIRAFAANAGNVYVGAGGGTTGLQVPDGASALVAREDSWGYPLDAGEAITLPLVDNTSEVWYICDNAGDDMHILVEGYPSQRDDAV